MRQTRTCASVLPIPTCALDAHQEVVCESGCHLIFFLFHRVVFFFVTSLLKHLKEKRGSCS